MSQTTQTKNMTYPSQTMCDKNGKPMDNVREAQAYLEQKLIHVAAAALLPGSYCKFLHSEFFTDRKIGPLYSAILLEQGESYVMHYELIRTEKGEWVWWMQTTKRFGGREFYYRDDLLTYVFLQSIKAYKLTKLMRGETSFSGAINSVHAVLYAVFVDPQKWKYYNEVDKDSDPNDEFDSSSGWRKWCKFGGREFGISYESGSHLETLGSSYFYTMRATVDNHIMVNCDEDE